MNSSGLQHRHVAPASSNGTLRPTDEAQNPMAKALAAIVEVAHYEPVQVVDAVHMATNPPADPHLDHLDPPAPSSVRLQKFHSEPPLSEARKEDGLGKEQNGGTQTGRRGVAEPTGSSASSVPVAMPATMPATMPAAVVADPGALTHAATAPTTTIFATDRSNPNRGESRRRRGSKRERVGNVIL